jgi:nitrite reductase/ring-hydroxylating ferredoxin subunit
VPTRNVPVGGGVILASANVVVTQPRKGTFEGFSATCTHQGCLLANVAGGTINCGCHGSQFSITDGSNVAGPSGTPAGSVAALPRVGIKVHGPDVVMS